MPEIDPRLIQAALAGSLPADEAADVLLAVLGAYTRVEADRIIGAVNAAYRGAQPHVALRREPSHRYEDDPVLRRAQRVLLQEAANELGRDWLLDRSEAVDRFSAAFGNEVAEDRLESHRRAGFAVAIVLDSEFRFPSFQFGEDGNLRQAAARVNRRLLTDMHPWAAVSWWIYPDGRLLDRRPYELLTEEDSEPMLTRLALASVGPAE